MGLFKRASWHSGLTYRQVCPVCKTEIFYKDDKLDFRPWFADGFVYCPKCQKPLRHNENYAINAVEPETVDLTKEVKGSDEKCFCTNCGKKLAADDKFCSGCGTQR